jgi:hypothetical protein
MNGQALLPNPGSFARMALFVCRERESIRTLQSVVLLTTPVAARFWHVTVSQPAPCQVPTISSPTIADKNKCHTTPAPELRKT